MQLELKELISSVRSPFRYIGGEVGSLAKPWDEAETRICLAFPDAYEIGMSHLGLAILYNIVNNEPHLLADRVFTPWADMEKELISRNIPLFSLEQSRPVKDFDIVGFSLAYELTYTNVLSILKLSDIPLRAKDRDKSHPLIIAGGPCAFNPEPVAPFFDAIVIGDGEQAILKIAEAYAYLKKNNFKRHDLFESLAKIDGVYVPILGTKNPVKKAHVADLNSAAFPQKPVVPHAATQERIAVEVSRGCARGCRFCQAGYIYRPVRQRTGECAANLACSGLLSAGCEEFSFLSLSIGDWAPLSDALMLVHNNLKGVSLKASLPSLRVESLSQKVIDALGRGRSGSFTLAPEAGTERMRLFINKGNTDEDLYSSVEKVFQSGWHAIKLYFMIGLPGETEAEIDGIVQISNRCLDIGKKHHRRSEVTVSVSTFVPKPHTPFQWERQISIDEILELQRTLKKRLRRPGLFFKWHDAEMSFMEGVFSRGGQELADAIEEAHTRGARFDGWEECFDIGRWRDSFSKVGIVPETYLEKRDLDKALPWEFLKVGPSRKFLIGELEKAKGLLATPDCTTGDCSVCGICDFEEIKNSIAKGETQTLTVGPEKLAVRAPTCYRLQYKKEGRSAFLGSIETLDALRRALRASGLKLCYSEGYHPRTRVSAGPALPVGIESLVEFVDVEINNAPSASEIVSILKNRLPDGMEVLEANLLEVGHKAIDVWIKSSSYEISFSGGILKSRSLAQIVQKFSDDETVLFVRIRNEKRQEINLKDYIRELAVLDEGVLGVSIENIQPILKISEVISALCNLPEEEMKQVCIKKVAVKNDATLKVHACPDDTKCKKIPSPLVGEGQGEG